MHEYDSRCGNRESTVYFTEHIGLRISGPFIVASGLVVAGQTSVLSTYLAL